MKPFYITTTLPYVNADPHMGHALEFIQADVIARYQRQKLGKDGVFFNIGTDEHGLKIFQKAAENNKTPKEFTDFYADRFKEFCVLFDISYDNFYRTSEAYHVPTVHKIWEACMAKGDIYKKQYEGLYCVGCESFKTEKDLVDGLCPDHGKAPVFVSEENYFFRLSNYRDVLLAHFKATPEFLSPKARLKELENFVADLEDISISRSKDKVPWGVPVPGDPDQTIYVWFDALPNYIGAVGYADDPERFAKYWPGVQIFGPDNLRFQCAIWQGMLASAGLPLTQKALMHGTILDDQGRKMSKTLGNVVSPFEQREKYGLAYLRYYMGAVLPTYGDSAFKEDDLKNVCNADLADTYGNLLTRVVHLANVKEATINDEAAVEPSFRADVEVFAAKAHGLFEQYELTEAYKVVHELGIFANRYIVEKEPWKMDNAAQIQVVLNNLSYALKVLTDFYEPVIPEEAAKARAALAAGEKIVLFQKIV